MTNIKSADGQPARVCAGIDLLTPARFGLLAQPIYVAHIPCGSIRRGEHLTSNIPFLILPSYFFLCVILPSTFYRFYLLTFPVTSFVTFQPIRKGNALTTILPRRYTYYYDYEISCCHFCNRTCHRLRCARSITQPGRVAFTG
jgi:hypothetical protein